MTENQTAVWVDGDPLMEAIAAAVHARCETGTGGIVHEDPRNIAAIAASVARTFGAYSAADLAAAQADVDHLNAEFPDEPQDGNGWPGDEDAEPGTRGWTV